MAWGDMKYVTPDMCAILYIMARVEEFLFGYQLAFLFTVLYPYSVSFASKLNNGRNNTLSVVPRRQLASSSCDLGTFWSFTPFNRLPLSHIESGYLI